MNKTNTYIVTHLDKTVTKIFHASSVRQIFAFLEFRDDEGELIVAINRDNIKYYSIDSATKVPKVYASFKVVKGTR